MQSFDAWRVAYEQWVPIALRECPTATANQPKPLDKGSGWRRSSVSSGRPAWEAEAAEIRNYPETCKTFVILRCCYGAALPEMSRSIPD